jgi:L-threonylcarbamoyladenylate synthase
LQQGELIAYLTESIYEVGCDPDNESTEDKLLADNKRPGGKSLILVAKTYSQ